MVKVLIIADDFTGALDTGVQFAQKKIKTKVIGKYKKILLSAFSEDLDVLVINAETRHLSKEEAYKKIYKIVKETRKLKAVFLYKKTDSGLRGNIGSELEASLDASKEKFITFVPAFPEMRRVTVNGIHYIDGTPVSESPFGMDRFDPVLSSDTRDLFKNTNKKIINYSVSENYQRHFQNEIGIFDATTSEDLENIMDNLSLHKSLGVLAGCAAFAEVLADKIAKSNNTQEEFLIPDKLLIICGSVNEVTKRQITYGESTGIERVSLDPEQELDIDYLNKPEGISWFEKILKKVNSGKSYIIEPGITKEKEIEEYRVVNNISESEVSRSIGKTLGNLFDRFIKEKVEAVIMIIGGDTLAKCIEREGWPEITIYRELYPGVVLSSIDTFWGKQWIISKSGGFGEKKLLSDLKEKIFLNNL